MNIPSWAYQLIKLAISIGSPYLLELIKKLFKKLPAEVLDLIDELIKSLLHPDVDNKEAKRAAHSKLKSCTGVGCPDTLKNDK